jgi:hypothetical protein
MDPVIVKILGTIPWFAWIAIVAIVGETTVRIVKMKIAHIERMQMIQQGMHPDAPHAKPYEPSEV